MNNPPPPHQQSQFSVSLRTKAASVPTPPHKAATEPNSALVPAKSQKREQKLRIYPQVPKLHNDPRTISLAVLIQSMCTLAANTLLAYQDFAGTNNEKHQRQKMYFLFELQEKFLKLYITLKFLTKIDYNQLMQTRAELTQLHELAYCFQFASDSLFFVNDLTKRMKEAPWDVPVASHVLIEGKFDMLPKCLEADSFHEIPTAGGADVVASESQSVITEQDEESTTPATTTTALAVPQKSSILFISQSEREQHDMQRLIHDHLLLYLLGTSIPPEMTIEDIKEGMVNVHVPGEFKAQLTLTTRKHLPMPLKIPASNGITDAEPKADDYHLKLVKIRLLTNQSDILASPLDANVTHRLAHLIQSRFDQRLHPHPLLDMYQVVHRVCLRLSVDILYQQSLQLGRGRLNNLIQVKHKYDEESRELRFVVGYWLGAPTMKSLELKDGAARTGSTTTTESLGTTVVTNTATASFRNHFSFRPTPSNAASGYRTELDISLLSAINAQPAGEVHVYVNNDKKCLTVEHQPCQLQCSVLLEEFLSDQVSNLSNLNFSAILMKCIKMHTRERLYTLQQYIDSETDLATRLEADSNLIVTLFEEYELNIFVDWRTGKFQFELLYDQQLVFPEDAESNSLVFFGDSNPLLGISEIQDQVNLRPYTVVEAFLDIQAKCILYAYSRAANILDYDTYPKSLYEKVRRKVVDVSTNKILREHNCIYIAFPNGKNLIHIRVEKVDVDSPTKRGGIKRIKTTFSLLLMAQNLIMDTPPKQGTVATARGGLARTRTSPSKSASNKRRRLGPNEFSSALDHLNHFVKENRRRVVRHSLYQGLISLRAVFHETDEPGLISLNYLIPDDSVDNSKTRVFIRTTEYDSWSAEIRCAFPSIFPPEKSFKEEQFHSVDNREPSKAKIEIVSHDSYDGSAPSTHSIFLHYSMDTDNINIFYADLKMLHIMSYLARQLEELKPSADKLFPYMTFTVRKCHYTGIIIEYSPRSGTSNDAPYYARIRCERGTLRLMLTPSHDMQTFVDLHLKTHRDMAKFLRLLESVCIPMIQVHKSLSAPQDHWTILSRNLGQLRLEYRKRGIIYEMRFAHGACEARELARSGTGFPVFHLRRDSNNVHTLVERMCEHAQSKYICLYLQKRMENSLEYQVPAEGHIVFRKDNMAFVFKCDPTTYRLHFSVECPEEVLTVHEKNNLQQTFLQMYDRSETLDFRSSLNSFGNMLRIPPTYMRALMEHVSLHSNDPLATQSGQNCKLLLQVPSTLSLPPQLARSAQQNTNTFHNKYMYESSFFIEAGRMHMLFRFSNPQDASEYVDIPIVLFISNEETNFKFFDCNPPDRIGDQILAQAQQEKQRAERGLFFSHVIGVCKRTPISQLRNML